MEAFKITWFVFGFFGTIFYFYSLFKNYKAIKNQIKPHMEYANDLAGYKYFTQIIIVVTVTIMSILNFCAGPTWLVFQLTKAKKS